MSASFGQGQPVDIMAVSTGGLDYARPSFRIIRCSIGREVLSDQLSEKGASPVGISPEERQRVRQEMARRDERAPRVGDMAPDFELPLLDGGSARVRLSSLVGKPVALIFGSYT